METIGDKKSLFHFENPRQGKIYASLNRFIGEAPASFYKDTCKIYVGGCDLETKTHLIGHLMREIFGWIIEIMLPVDYVNPTSLENYKQKIKDAATGYNIDLNNEMVKFWLDSIADSVNGLHSWAHRESMASVRPSTEEFDELWNGTELLLDFLLDKIEAKYLAYTEQLDAIIAKATISDEDIKKIKKHIPLNQTTMGYFFNKLDHQECLTSLRSNDFFKYPQKPIVHEDGGVSYPYWPQMTYLLKMSKIPEVQDTVLSICLEIETDNNNIQVDILDVSLNLPADKSVQLTSKSAEWFAQIKSWFHSEKYGKLFVHLAQGGFKKEALELASKLLAVQPSPRPPSVVEGYSFPHEPVALISDWQYEEVLKDDFPSLVEITGFDAIKILLDQLENYIKLSDTDREKGSKDDYSYIWRNAIEDSAQNIGENIRDTIINGARNSLEAYLKKYPDEIGTVVAELESRKLNIFRRISLHLLRLFHNGAEKLIRDRLLNADEFKDASNRLTHEYYLLAEKHASLLSKDERERIWEWLMKGADKEAYKQWRKKDDHVNVTEEELQKYVSNWQMYHLIPFKDIDPEWQKFFEGLKQVVGEPIHPSLRSWTSGGSWGPSSIVSDQQLNGMEPKEVAEYLRKWVPEANDPLDRSREGTGRALITQITSNPNKWINDLDLFSELDPTYVRSIFVGYRDAIKQGNIFDWKPLLNLAKKVLNKPIKIKDRKSSGVFGDDPDWSWCRHTIVELIAEGLKKGSEHLAVSFRELIWDVLEPLTNDPNPTPQYEAEYLEANPDPLSLAINTTRGDAMDAAIQYGIWLKESTPDKEHFKWTLKENAPELLKVLGEHLDIEIDPSVAIRALYGEKLGQLGWLDLNWVKDNEDMIFPEDLSHQKYFNAVWESYITYVPAYDNLFEIIKKQYVRAINEIGNHTDRKHNLESPEQSLAQHLTAYYWRGIIKLESGLFADFYKTATTELKAEVIEFIGRVCKNDTKILGEVKTRFVELLENRISAVKSDTTTQEEIQEFQNISWWIASEKFDYPWLLEKLLETLQLGCDVEGDHLILEKFTFLANQYPLLTIRCTRLMVVNDKKGWGVVHWRDELKDILKTALNSSDTQAKKEAKEFINILAARSHIEFKDLLN